jgi:pimeloyl-ACP methyl ester carboxylesterase
MSQRWTRRGTTGAVAVLLLAGLLAACTSEEDPQPPATPGEQGGPPWPDEGPTIGPLVSGTEGVVAGTWYWTDYAYDDRGANRDAGDRTVIDDAGGDATYPAPLTNAADLIQLQVGADGDQLELTAVLETLTDPTVPALVLGFGTDGDATTGAPALPFLDWSPSEPLGLEQAVVLTAGGGRLLTATPEGEWDQAASTEVEVEVDPEENTLVADLPIDVPLPGERPQVVAATGLAAEIGLDPSALGDATTYDLAFVGGEEPYQWQDYVQADVLAGKEPPSDGGHPDVRTGLTFLPADVLGDASHTQTTLGHDPGFVTYLYRSELTLPEGIATGEDGLEYLGPYQPYLVWFGEDGQQADQPLSVFLHGSQQNHLGTVAPGGAYLGTARPLSEEVHQLAQYAVDGVDFSPHSTTVWPLGRGEGLGYQGIAEQDVLDVLADATLRLEPDEDRITLQGASMGGIGAFRLGARYPDHWSAVVPIIGFAPEETEGLLPNLTNVPIRQVNGAVDPLIEPALAEATTDLLDELELQYRAWMLDERGHEAGGYVYDCVYAALPELTRTSAPAHVTYTVDPATFERDPETGLDLQYDGAWWVSGIEAAGEEPATVEATSAAREDVDLEATHIDREGESGPDGGDLCGENPEVSTGDTWRERAVELEVVEERDPSNHLDVTFTAVHEATIDLEGAGIEPGDEVEVAVESDRAATLVLVGLAPGQEVVVAGDARTADDDGGVELDLEAGSTTVEADAA